MSHEELLRLADEVFWIIIVLAWLFGSVCGMLVTFLLAAKPRLPLSDAEDWALRMKDREAYRLDFTGEPPEEFKAWWESLADGVEPTKLRVVK